MTFPIPIKQLLVVNLTFRNVCILGALPGLLMSICSYPAFNYGSTLTVEESSTCQHPTSVAQNTRAFYFTTRALAKKKKNRPIKLGLRKGKFKLSVSVTSWVLSHKSLGERSVSESSVVFAYEVLCGETGERERQAQTGGGGGGEEFGLTTKLWQKQTGCTILKGRFNYKWCFHSEPSRNSLFFGRSSSPHPQQGLVWPGSEARRLTRVMHYEWCEGDINVLILVRAVWTLTQEPNANFSEERSRNEAGLIGLYCSGVMSCENSVFMHFKLTFLPLYSIPLSFCLQTLPLFPFISSERLSLSLPSKNSTGGGCQ